MAAAAFFAFLFGALLGLTMAALHFRGHEPGRALGIGHGLLQASGTALLIAGLAMSEDPGWGWGLLALIAVAAAGGLALFVRQGQKKPWPGALVLAHGTLGVLTVVLVGVWVFGGRAIDPGEVPLRSRGADAVEAPS